MDGWEKSGIEEFEGAICGEECDCVYMMLKRCACSSMRERRYNDASRVDNAIVYFWDKEMVCALRPTLAGNGWSALCKNEA